MRARDDQEKQSGTLKKEREWGSDVPADKLSIRDRGSAPERNRVTMWSQRKEGGGGRNTLQAREHHGNQKPEGTQAAHWPKEKRPT